MRKWSAYREQHNRDEERAVGAVWQEILTCEMVEINGGVEGYA